MNNNDPRFNIVRRTQKEIYRESGLSGGDPDAIIELFDPQKIANYLGVHYVKLEDIPSNDLKFKIAGMLDRRENTIYISNKFPAEQRRLTGMHEVIHWMLHEDVGKNVMHRDRPIENSLTQNNCDLVEREATNLACRYLMPEKLVKSIFAEMFLLPFGSPIQFEETVAFHLNIDVEKVSKMTDFQKAMKLVTAGRFNGIVIPLHRWFKISPTAMAIRLIELKLIAPDRLRGKPNLSLVR